MVCDVDIDECDGINPCSGGSSCINELGGYRCECVPGFTGQNCAEDINECLSYPCLNGGTCANEIGGFNCSCINGYFGETCVDISPCFRNCSEACLQGMLLYSMHVAMQSQALDDHSCTVLEIWQAVHNFGIFHFSQQHSGKETCVSFTMS